MEKYDRSCAYRTSISAPENVDRNEQISEVSKEPTPLACDKPMTVVLYQLNLGRRDEAPNRDKTRFTGITSIPAAILAFSPFLPKTLDPTNTIISSQLISHTSTLTLTQVTSPQGLFGR